MFLRRIRPSGRGARQTYWALVESYRTPSGSRQRVVAYLGKLTGRQSGECEQLPDRLGGKVPASPGLFAAGLRAEEAATIDLESLTVRRARDFGDVYLGGALWRLLGLEELLSRLLPAVQEDVSWEKVARIPGPPLTVRCVTRPDDHQAVLLERLGLELPHQIKRFRRPWESTLAKEIPPAIAPM
jgi:hypothetical protein